MSAPRRTALLVPALLALASCGEGGAIPRERLSLELRCAVSEVEFGVPFELRIVRRHARELELDAFDPRSLAPLVAELRSRRVREDEATREEVLELEARAFALHRVSIPALVASARDRSSGAGHEARSAGLELAVRSSLPPGDGGAPELPFAPRARRATWPYLLGGAAVALLAGLALAARRLRRERPAAPPPPPPEPAEPLHLALARELAALEGERAAAESDRAAAARFASALARIARAAIAERTELAAEVLTRAELVRALARSEHVRPETARSLDGWLARCERAQFARSGFAPGESEALLATARELLAALGPPAEAPR